MSFSGSDGVGEEDLGGSRVQFSDDWGTARGHDERDFRSDSASDDETGGRKRTFSPGMAGEFETGGMASGSGQTSSSDAFSSGAAGAGARGAAGGAAADAATITIRVPEASREVVPGTNEVYTVRARVAFLLLPPSILHAHTHRLVAHAVRQAYRIMVSAGATKEWTMLRRYSQFASLAKALSRVQDAEGRPVPVPKLPPKTLMRSTDPEFVRSRRHSLERWLKQLLRRAEFREHYAVRVARAGSSLSPASVLTRAVPTGCMPAQLQSFLGCDVQLGRRSGLDEVGWMSRTSAHAPGGSAGGGGCALL